MSVYVEDIREFRRTKLESKASWLDWRKGRFSQDEMASIKRGLDAWLTESCAESGYTKEETLSKLKWARDNKISAWCDIALHCSLPKRKIGSIRHCILRNFLAGSELGRWSKQQTEEFKRLQSIYGPRAWKEIALDTGRTLENVVNKGRQLASVSKSKNVKSVRFSRVDVVRLKMQNLLRDDAIANPYELQAIRPECKLVSLIRKYHFPSGDINDVYYIPASKIARKLHTSQTLVRSRWHRDILPCVISQISTRLCDKDFMDAYIVLRAHRACKGKLTDVDGNTVHPAYDWESLNIQAIAPLWPYEVTKTRLTSILKAHPRYSMSPLPQVIESVRDLLLKSHSREQIFQYASNHFTEFRRMINVIADRGDAYFEEDRKQTEAITEIVISD